MRNRTPPKRETTEQQHAAGVAICEQQCASAQILIDTSMG